MAISTLTLDGKRFVVLPENEYRSLKAKADPKKKPKAGRTKATKSTDAGDAAEANRRLANPTRIPAADVFKNAGV